MRKLFYSYSGGQPGLGITVLLLLIVDWRYHVHWQQYWNRSHSAASAPTAPLITVAGLCYTLSNLASLSNAAINNQTFIQGG